MTSLANSGPEARAEALVTHYERAGYLRVAPAILQPAEPFLDLSGEDIRRRMFLTADPAAGRPVPRPFRRRHPQEPVSDHRRPRRGIVSASRSHHSGGARLSSLGPCRSARRVQLPWAGLSLPRWPIERISTGRHRIVRQAGSCRSRCRNAGAGAGSDQRVRPDRG